jgi:hypothetical protein
MVIMILVRMCSIVIRADRLAVVVCRLLLENWGYYASPSYG